MTNKTHSVIYTGVTNDLRRRVLEHKGNQSTFTRKYHVHSLVYFEYAEDIVVAIEREKQIKAGSRQKKIALIKSVNPEWRDLADEIMV